MIDHFTCICHFGVKLPLSLTLNLLYVFAVGFFFSLGLYFLSLSPFAIFVSSFSPFSPLLPSVLWLCFCVFHSLFFHFSSSLSSLPHAILIFFVSSNIFSISSSLLHYLFSVGASFSFFFSNFVFFFSSSCCFSFSSLFFHFLFL